VQSLFFFFYKPCSCEDQRPSVFIQTARLIRDPEVWFGSIGVTFTCPRCAAPRPLGGPLLLPESAKKKGRTTLSQITFSALLFHSHSHLQTMSTPDNSTSQNQASIQGVGTTSNPLPAPARTQKDGGIGNSTVGTFSVRPRSLCCDRPR